MLGWSCDEALVSPFLEPCPDISLSSSHVLGELRPFINAEADIREVEEAQKYVEEDEAERAEVMDRIQEDLRG
jgi:hypothetical protein